MAEAPDIFAKQYLLTAGPTPLPPRVSQVMAEPILYHRAPAFVEIYARVLERLPLVFQTRNEVLCFAASGTGAMESAVANLVGPGDPAVVALMRQVRPALGASSATPTAPTPSTWRPSGARRWTRRGSTRRSPASAARRAPCSRPSRRPRPASSTTSGRSTRSRRAHGSVLCVDAVSGLGAVDLPQDEWGVDVVVSGSQKSLMCPPGLAFASVSERAMALAAENPGAPLLLRLGAHRRGSEARTPPNSRVHPGRDPVPRARRRARDALRGGPRRGLRPPRAARARRARRGRGARAGALRPRRRERERGHRGGASRARSTARRCRS